MFHERVDRFFIQVDTLVGVVTTHRRVALLGHERAHLLQIGSRLVVYVWMVAHRQQTLIVRIHYLESSKNSKNDD